MNSPTAIVFALGVTLGAALANMPGHWYAAPMGAWLVAIGAIAWDLFRPERGQ